jgi:hypothetical protein
MIFLGATLSRPVAPKRGGATSVRLEFEDTNA